MGQMIHDQGNAGGAAAHQLGRQQEKLDGEGINNVADEHQQQGKPSFVHHKKMPLSAKKRLSDLPTDAGLFCIYYSPIPGNRQGFFAFAQKNIQKKVKFRFIELFALQKKYVIPRSAAEW